MDETDAELREIIVEIDKSENIDVTTWEADWIESAVYQWIGSWTPGRRKIAEQIVEKYQGKLE